MPGTITDTIYSSDLGGTTATPLGMGIDPRISPDGTKIVYAYGDGTAHDTDIYVMNADGSNKVNLTPDSTLRDFHPSWSPDSRHILFDRTNATTGQQDVYEIDTAGNGARLLVQNARDASWSPDGATLLFMRPTDGSHLLYTASADGLNVRPFTTRANPNSNTMNSLPRWSPDGNWIAWVANDCGCGTSEVIRMAHPDGSGRIDLYPSGALHPNSIISDIAWSGDGTHLLFLYQIGNNTAPQGAEWIVYSQDIQTLSVSQVAMPFPSTDILHTITIGDLRMAAASAAPAIASLPDRTLHKGEVYTVSGSFADGDSASWTAVVNYGDGSGTQPLALSGMDFTLNHTYTQAGSYPITVMITDDQGIKSLARAQITVTNSAPTIGAITAPVAPVAASTSITANAPFTDLDPSDMHSATWSWGDGTSSTGTVTETNGSGVVSDTHTYTQTGVYSVHLTVTDASGASATATYDYVVVHNPASGALAASGKYTSEPSWYIPDPAATGPVKVGVQAKYNNNVLNGQVKVTFNAGNLTFTSTSLQWLVVNGAKAQLKATGTINGSGNYTLILTAVDGKQTDGDNLIRIKIANSTGTAIYDTQSGYPDTADPTTVMNNGSVNIQN